MNAQIKKCTKSQAESIKRIQQQDMKNFQHVVKQKKKIKKKIKADRKDHWQRLSWFFSTQNENKMTSSKSWGKITVNTEKAKLSLQTWVKTFLGKQKWIEVRGYMCTYS